MCRYLHWSQRPISKQAEYIYVSLWSISIWWATFTEQPFLMAPFSTKSSVVDFNYFISLFLVNELYAILCKSEYCIHCYYVTGSRHLYANSSDRIITFLVSNDPRRIHYNIQQSKVVHVNYIYQHNTYYNHKMWRKQKTEYTNTMMWTSLHTCYVIRTYVQ